MQELWRWIKNKNARIQAMDSKPKCTNYGSESNKICKNYGDGLKDKNARIMATS